MGKPMSEKQVPMEDRAGLGSTEREERKEGHGTSVPLGGEKRETQEKT